ncbi:hypothetical protein F4678DRAFT_422249, partial [Xylaria arbuscula]
MNLDIEHSRHNGPPDFVLPVPSMVFPPFYNFFYFFLSLIRLSRKHEVHSDRGYIMNHISHSILLQLTSISFAVFGMC